MTRRGEKEGTSGGEKWKRIETGRRVTDWRKKEDEGRERRQPCKDQGEQHFGKRELG